MREEQFRGYVFTAIVTALTLAASVGILSALNLVFRWWPIPPLNY